MSKNPPQQTPGGQIKHSMLSKLSGETMGLGFIGLDTYMRVQEGENVIPALAKAAVTNAFWAAMPGGWATMLGYTAATMLPAFSNAVDQGIAGVSQKLTPFGQGYTPTQQSELLKTDGINRMMQNRQLMMQRHAMNNRKIY